MWHVIVVDPGEVITAGGVSMISDHIVTIIVTFLPSVDQCNNSGHPCEHRSLEYLIEHHHQHFTFNQNHSLHCNHCQHLIIQCHPYLWELLCHAVVMFEFHYMKVSIKISCFSLSLTAQYLFDRFDSLQYERVLSKYFYKHRENIWSPKNICTPLPVWGCVYEVLHELPPGGQLPHPLVLDHGTRGAPVVPENI